MAVPSSRSPRQTINLNGTWQFCPVESGAPAPPGAVWGEMPVPSNWHLDGLPNYAGDVLFRRRFQLDQPPGDRGALLRFHGVDYSAEVWLNGTRVGSHVGYFAPFEFEVTDLLRDENELEVLVSAPLEAPSDWPDRKRLIKGIFQHHDCRPGAWDPERGQEQGSGGIWNRVELELVPPIYLVGLRVDARPPRQAGDPAPLRIDLQVHRSASAGQLVDAFRVSLLARGRDPTDEAVPLLDVLVRRRAADDASPLRFDLELPDPRLWWPWDQGEPYLYELTADLRRVDGTPLDARSVDFGVRELQIADDTTWWLNGRRLFPRGTNLIPTQWLSSYDQRAIERDVDLLRQANVNAVRVHAHVNRDELYSACDRVGIMVWQDFALQWSYQESDDFRDEACRQIAEMGRHLANHPSIVVWCCHNEPSANRDTLDPFLAAALRAVDASRVIEEASDFRTHPYPGWYWSGVDEFRACPGGPFISEFGAQALPGREALEAMFRLDQLWPPAWPAWAYHDFQYDQTVNVAGLPPGESLDDWIARSQTYQACLLQVAIESYRRAKYRPISGLFQFMFVECWDAISWAVLDHQRRQKLGYPALKRAFQPLLPSIDLRREHALPGGEIQAGFWLVNDLPRAFVNLRLHFGLRAPDGRVWWSELRTVPHLEADAAVPVFSIQESGFSPWRLPPEIPPGHYEIFADLFDAGGELLAANLHPFDVRPPPPSSSKV
jgi:beta-mannosidase